MTQESISKVLNISRSAISMALTEAKNNGIIEIRIKDPSENNAELAEKMEERFELKKCIVVPSGTYDAKALLKVVTSQAERFAAGIFQSHSAIGVAWGTACHEFMKIFSENTPLCDISVVPLVGMSQLLTTELQLNESVEMFAKKLRGYPVFIYSPGICETLEDRENIEHSAYMKPIQDLWRHLDYAVVGIGSIRRGDNPSIPRKNNKGTSAVETHLYPNILQHSEQPIPGIKSLVEEICRYPDIAVGNICAREINIRGEFIDSDFNRKLVAISGDDLKKSKNVIAIAVGSAKVIPIIGALRTKAIHYLVTDENTAAQIIDLMDLQLLPK